MRTCLDRWILHCLYLCMVIYRHFNLHHTVAGKSLESEYFISLIMWLSCSKTITTMRSSNVLFQSVVILYVCCF